MRVDVLTLFPELIEHALSFSMPKQAKEKGLFALTTTNFRTFTKDKHQTVDDRPYGGGPGMVMMCDPVIKAVDSLNLANDGKTGKFILCPRGKPFDQAAAQHMAELDRLVFICGHYEGFDERIYDELQDFTPIGLGPFVLSGGEMAALSIIDAVVRLIPGVLGHEDSTQYESFQDPHLLDHPHYTRPPEYNGKTVPEILTSGNHKAIEDWRKEQAKALTQKYRPDLLG